MMKRRGSLTVLHDILGGYNEYFIFSHSEE